MKKIEILLDQYGESHQNKQNKLIHWFCVPLIFFSLLCMVWSIPFPFPSILFGYINWATIGLLLVLLYYSSLSLALALGMGVFSVVLVMAISVIDQATNELLPISIFIFIAAWLGQFYGHKIEGKKPSFLKDIQFLLIGPAWLMRFIYKKLGIAL